MNKETWNHSNEEQPAADVLQSIAEDMQISHTFQSQLAAQLKSAHAQHAQHVRRSPGWLGWIVPVFAWTAAALLVILVVDWSLSTLISHPAPAASSPAAVENSFAERVAAGEMCAGPLVSGQGFSVFASNLIEAEFHRLGAGQDIGELRSFAWAPDGTRLAVVGNTRGSGNLYLWDPTRDELQPVLAQTDFGYLMGVAWSPDGQQLLTWEISSNTAFYMVEANGTSVVRHALSLQLFETPRMAPGGGSVLFYGADRATSGLFEVNLETLEARLVSAGVEGENRFAWSPDGSRLAYIEMDRQHGEGRLVVESQSEKLTYAAFPIPSGSGSALPAAGNLSWSPDGTELLFDMGMYHSGKSIYLARAEPAGIVQLVENGHAPSVSPDGRCLAVLNRRQVFVSELNLDKPASSLFWVGELPSSQGGIDVRMDQLQWKPE